MNGPSNWREQLRDGSHGYLFSTVILLAFSMLLLGVPLIIF